MPSGDPVRRAFLLTNSIKFRDFNQSSPHLSVQQKTYAAGAASPENSDLHEKAPLSGGPLRSVIDELPVAPDGDSCPRL